MVVGLSGSGKTSIINHLKGRNPQKYSVIPTWHITVENVHIDEQEMSMWDFSGNERFRPLWLQWDQKCKDLNIITHAMIYVIDSGDRTNIKEAALWLNKSLNEYKTENKAKIPLLIIANKQDLDDAMSIDEIGYELGIYKKYDVKDYYDVNKALSNDVMDIIFSYLPIQTYDKLNGRAVNIVPNVCPVYLDTHYIVYRNYDEIWGGFNDFNEEYPNSLQDGIRWLIQKM